MGTIRFEMGLIIRKLWSLQNEGFESLVRNTWRSLLYSRNAAMISSRFLLIFTRIQKEHTNMGFGSLVLIGITESHLFSNIKEPNYEQLQICIDVMYYLVFSVFCRCSKRGLLY